MSLFVDPEWIKQKEPTLTPEEQRAWELYCERTSGGDLDVRDHWDELPPQVQKIYLEEAAFELQD